MGEVRSLWIPGPAGRIEAALRVACPARGAAVIAHPHPLYGGTLHNPVVFHTDREMHRAGWTTLRFNFRGVGTSDGAYDSGNGETADYAAAASWLRGVALGVPLIGAGVSFGSWCGLRHAASDPSIQAFLAIALPIRSWPFGELESFGRPLGVVQGSEDEFGPVEEVRERLAGLTPPGRLRVLEGTGHLFRGRVMEAAREAVGAAEELLQTA